MLSDFHVSRTSVDATYRFDTNEGEKTLAKRFDGRSQLLVCHFMFGPDWTEGCTWSSRTWISTSPAGIPSNATTPPHVT